MKCEILVVLWLIFFGSSCTSSLQNAIMKMDEIKELNIIEDTMRLLAEGRKDMVFSHKPDNIFFLGITGSGKTTVALILTGDNSKLISIDKGGEWPTGQYVIVDEIGLIGNSTIVSQTILPFLFIDVVPDTTYYDCPGYSDTRNSSVDITSTFFISDAIDNTTTVKFVYIIDHYHVKEGGSRDGFPELCKHVSNFMHDIDKYADAIGAIINKVDLHHLSDEMIINGVVQFLNNAKNDFLSDPNPKPYYEDAIKFIDILVERNGKTTPRLAITRTPDAPGPISEIKKIQDSKNITYNMIYNNLKYVKKNTEDFGYTISESSQLDVYDLSISLNEDIASILQTASNEIIMHFEEEENDLSLDMYVLNSTFNDAAVAMNDMSKNPELINTTDQFMTKFNETLIKLDVSLSESISQNLSTLFEFFKFLESVSLREIKIDSVNWVHSLLGAKTFINELDKFYMGLPNLHNKLSAYQYQSDTSKYNVANLNDWGQSDKPKGIKITKDNWKLFTEKVNMLELKEIEMNDVKLHRVNTILEWVLKYEVKTECSGSTLTISGEFIKITDITSLNCSARFITVMAIYNVFFDTDLNIIGNLAEVSVMGQKWEMTGPRKVDLTGATGSETTQKANSGDGPSPNGSNGKLGGTGGNGGQFFGFAKIFQGGNDLTIVANGGRGGNGQPGGDGFKVTNRLEVPSGNAEGMSCSRMPRREFRPSAYKKTDERFHSEDSWFKVYHIYEYDYDVYGDCGGHGGNGGNGGKGGQAGGAEIIALEAASNVKKSLSEGDKGKCGNGGAVGINGLVLQTTCVNVESYTCVAFICGASDYDNHWEGNNHNPNNIDCGNLVKGKECTSKMDHPSELNDEYNLRLDKKAQINKYKSFIKSNINVGLRKQTLETFIDLIDKKT